MNVSDFFSTMDVFYICLIRSCLHDIASYSDCAHVNNLAYQFFNIASFKNLTSYHIFTKVFFQYQKVVKPTDTKHISYIIYIA